MLRLRTASILVPAVLAACVSKPKPPPAPPPRPVVRPAPLPPPVLGWQERALTPGVWTYRADTRGGIASFGASGREAVLTVRCDRAAQRIAVARAGTVAGRMTLRATTGARTYEARPVGGSTPLVVADLAPRDPQLDALAFSRGRFLVALEGAADVVVPSWPELARVTEDCRG